MKKKRGNDSSANDFIWVLGLRAPPPKKMMPVNVVLAEKKPEETHRDFLIIDQGQMVSCHHQNLSQTFQEVLILFLKPSILGQNTKTTLFIAL
ncbi:hypothetical protein KY285_034927 [Solanum tuberosum]|nr:hypothetical protein KY284_034985 [Solanum tuberosum]KAH0635230.1 hypothetical protein KY289_035145 [Solanum tuberosum]KAH0638341.1 hypothetical protein KY285_034927 [Solanum tuberosum]